MSVQLQARGKGLCPVNTSCTSDTLAGFLEREGYTDIRVVTIKDKKKVETSEQPQPAPRRAPRRVTRRPRT